MTVFIMFLKIIVYGDMYYVYQACYPPAFFMGFTESGRHYVHDLTHTDNFQSEEDKEAFMNRLQSLGKEIANVPSNIQHMSESIWITIKMFLRERFGVI